ncbi:hypothetical protein C0991_000031 [Blastosporella zonata]|nr:hypothetical protein C0991_000031 [Blastosporella zonata]
MSNTRRPKKQRTGGLQSFGAPSELDTPSNVRQDPSSSASSTRDIGPGTPPALSTLCARVFVLNFVKLRQNKETWERVSQWLTALPDILIPKIFLMLQNSYPTYLAHEIIVTYFLRGPSVTLRKDLPGVKKRTILDIARFNPGVQELELTGFDDISDNTFADLLRNLTSLSSLIMRGCTKVGAESMRAVAQVAPDLRTLNLNYTSVTPASLFPVARACPHLEVIKLAGIQNWTDATLSRSFADLPDGFQIPALHTLKLRQTSITDAALGPILKVCPALRRLDISFTLVRHPPQLLLDPLIPALEKLSLTSTDVSPSDLVDVISQLPELRTLSIGAMGVNRGPRASIGNTSAMTLTDDALLSLTMVLEQFQHLENKLNLAGIHAICSSDLAGLVSTDTDPVSPLETLNLNNTAIDDEAGVYIAACPSLKTLAVAGTKITGAH